MSPLERLFRLEIEYHWRLRKEAPGTADAGSLHTSWAIQSGYEPLIKAIGPLTGADIERLRTRLALAGDPRDVLAARDSIKGLLGISQLEA